MNRLFGICLTIGAVLGLVFVGACGVGATKGLTAAGEDPSAYVDSAVPRGSMSDVVFMRSQSDIFAGPEMAELAKANGSQCDLSVRSEATSELSNLASVRLDDLDHSKFERLLSQVGCDPLVRLQTDGSILVVVDSVDSRASVLQALDQQKLPSATVEIGVADTEIDVPQGG